MGDRLISKMEKQARERATRVEAGTSDQRGKVEVRFYPRSKVYAYFYATAGRVNKGTAIQILDRG